MDLKSLVLGEIFCWQYHGILQLHIFFITFFDTLTVLNKNM